MEDKENFPNLKDTNRAPEIPNPVEGQKLEQNISLFG